MSFANPNTYDKGDTVRFSVEFYKAGALDDPTDVYFDTKDPSGNVTTLHKPPDAGIVKSAVGCYYSDLVIDESGTWYYRWRGVGNAVDGVTEQKIIARESVFT